MQVSSATGMVSAGSAGALSAEACVVKGNCSDLAASIAVIGVASRFPGLGVAARDARVASSTSGTGTELALVGNFSNERLAFAHYAKHVKGINTAMGKNTLRSKSPDLAGLGTYPAYVDAARAFMGSGARPGTIEGLRLRDGALIRLDPVTGEFGVRRSDGVIASYFVPDDPLGYFWKDMSRERHR
ncbi:hypothetical protein [Kribbella endophytica]